MTYFSSVGTSLTLTNVFIFLLALLIAKALLSRLGNKPRLPPGPKGYPIIGSLFDMPSDQEWAIFAKWGAEFGDLCSVTVFGQPIIIINSHKMAVEVLDKKSAIYSDRQVSQMAGELAGWKDSLPLLPYGDRFRSYRKFFHHLFGSRAIAKQFFPVEALEARRFLKRLLHTPNDFREHIQHNVAAVILRITYGYEVKEKNDKFIGIVETAMRDLVVGLAPGAGGFLVNSLPFLRYIPDWFPGAAFKATAKIWKTNLSAMVNEPFNQVQHQMANGTAERSFVSTFLEKAPDAQEEKNLRFASSSMYGGGSTTSFATMEAFFLTMALHPEMQAKAQQEIDDVIGNDRLPSFDDWDRLPYVNALCNEVFRYHTVVPTSIAHRATEDGFINGYFIPKGSLIIPNLWQMLHDPEVYADPMTFDPSRFLVSGTKAPEQDPRDICFGFGRRICPAKHLAEAATFINIASILAVFKISKVGELVHGQTTGMVSFPEAFKCSVKARSQKSAALVSTADEEI